MSGKSSAGEPGHFIIGDDSISGVVRSDNFISGAGEDVRTRRQRELFIIDAKQHWRFWRLCIPKCRLQMEDHGAHPGPHIMFIDAQ